MVYFGLIGLSETDLEYLRLRAHVECVLYGHPKIVDDNGDKLDICPDCGDKIFEHVKIVGVSPIAGLANLK